MKYIEMLSRCGPLRLRHGIIDRVHVLSSIGQDRFLDRTIECRPVHHVRYRDAVFVIRRSRRDPIEADRNSRCVAALTGGWADDGAGDPKPAGLGVEAVCAVWLSSGGPGRGWMVAGQRLSTQAR